MLTNIHSIYCLQICKTRFPNLAELQEERAAAFRAEQRAEKQQQKVLEKQYRREREEQAKMRSFE